MHLFFAGFPVSETPVQMTNYELGIVFSLRDEKEADQF
jgi:hypothetical protein